MTAPSILVEREGSILWITLNRPERLNALTHEMLERLGAVLESARTDESRVLVIRGAGRAFSAGHDLSSDSPEVTEPGDSVDDYERQMSYVELFLRIWDHPKPVIAAVHGYCMAGAAQLATFVDFVVTAEDAVIAASPVLPLGGGFISPLWAFRVGANRAKLLSFIPGRRITGVEAAEWGWAIEAVPSEDLTEHVRRLAHDIAKTPAHVLRMKKVAINRVLELQGFRAAAAMGAETDVVVHNTHAVNTVKTALEADGLKETLRRFQAGSLLE